MNYISLCLIFSLIFKFGKFDNEIIFKDDFTDDYRKNWQALGAGEIGCTSNSI